MKTTLTPASLPPPPPGYEARLPRHPEATGLLETGKDHRGRPILLIPQAAAAWHRLQTDAARDGISFVVISSYRSHEYQADLVRRKLQSGKTLTEVLTTSAYPGHSEHHTGRALDVATAEEPYLEERFADTSAFRWLEERASDFGFHLSYPKNNPAGLVFEPWHWCWHPNPSAP